MSQAVVGLDFVVADSEHNAKFAVEFDGPNHGSDARVIERDLKKNLICEKLELPLARVSDEHSFRARGMEYLEWLAEIYSRGSRSRTRGTMAA